MRTTRLLAALATAALVALVAGCGGESPKPTSLPSTSASPSPSASPSATPPVLPAAAKSKTKAGAIAFARHFIELVNYASAAGQTKELRANFNSLCTKCTAFADTIDQTYSDGGRIEGGAWHARTLRYYGIRNEVAFVDAIVDFDAQSWTKRAGAESTKYPASRNHLKAFNLRWTSTGAWAVSALDPDS